MVSAIVLVASISTLSGFQKSKMSFEKIYKNLIATQ